MFSAFQPSAFQNTGFQIDGSGAPPVIPPVVSGPTPAGRGSRDTQVRRRKYILPDGQIVLATREEAYALIQQFAEYAKPEDLPRTATRAQRRAARKRAAVETPAAIREADIRWNEVSDASEPLVRIELPQIYRWNPAEAELALAMLRRRKDDEEALLALIL